MTMKRRDQEDQLVKDQLAENIERRRAGLGIDQAELAGRVELPVSEIGALEAGERQPLASTLKKLAGALDCPLSDLLDGVRWVMPGEEGEGHVERRRRGR
jgi:transcriptional regulator with XRE-family HTH domain